MQVTRIVALLFLGAALFATIRVGFGPASTHAQSTAAERAAISTDSSSPQAKSASAPIPGQSRPASTPASPAPAPVLIAQAPVAPAPVVSQPATAPAAAAPAPAPVITIPAPTNNSPAAPAPETNPSASAAPTALQTSNPPGATTNAPAGDTNAISQGAGPAPAQEPTKSTVTVKTRSISLQEAIDLALQHNLDVQIQRFLPDLAQFTLDGTYGGYDPTLSANGQHGYSLSPGQFDPYQNRFFGGAETENDTFNTGLSGMLPFGTTYSLTANASDVYGIRQGAIPPEFENTTANAAASTLRQPLLRNFWINSTRANILIAKNRLKYNELALRLQMMTTITAVEQAYYNLIFARENIRVQETALQLAERLLWENRKKVEVGQLAPLDEKQAQAQAAASKADLLSAQQALDAQENILKGLITDDYAKWHDVHLIPAESLIAVPPLLDVQDSWQKGERLRPDLIQARLDVQRDTINVRLAKNQLFPELDLIGQYGYSGNGKEFSGAIGQIRDMNNPFWYYGASISYPLGNQAPRANYKLSKATKAQNELILKQKEQNILIQIDNSVKLVQSDFERVDATKQAREFAQEALAAEQKKLENGKSTSYLVLQAQRDLTSAAYSEVQALANYNNDLAQLALAEGYTLERHHINVQVK
jgi:outer membrane protein